MPYKRVYKRPPNRSRWMALLKGAGYAASAAVNVARRYRKRKAKRGTALAVRRPIQRRRIGINPGNSLIAGMNKLKITNGSTATQRIQSDWTSTQRSRSGPTKRLMMYRALQAQMDKTILYYRGVNPFGTNLGGYYKMNFGPAAETPSTGNGSSGIDCSWLPFYALSLNSAPQADTSSFPTIDRLRTFTTTSVGNQRDGGLDWYQSLAMTNTGSGTVSQWYVETSGSSQASGLNSNSVGQTAVCAWQQVKLNLYGSKTRPIKYQIMVVQFKHDKELIDPFKAKRDDDYVNQMTPEAQQVYQELVKQLTWNPIDKVNVYNAKKHFKIIHSETITVMPPKTIDQDQVPNVHTYKYFVRPGAVCNFADYASNSTINEPAQAPVTNELDYRGANRSDLQRTNQNFPTNHTVMFISATDFGTYAADGATTRSVFSSDVHGSFDAYVRTCWIGNRYT